MAALDFYFDYRSPYAYLAQTQVRKLGVEIAWRPFEILQLMDQVGNVPTSITCKPKGKYLGADLMRWVATYKVPFQRHLEIAAGRRAIVAPVRDAIGRGGLRHQRACWQAREQLALVGIARRLWRTEAAFATRVECARRRAPRSTVWLHNRHEA